MTLVGFGSLFFFENSTSDPLIDWSSLDTRFVVTNTYVQPRAGHLDHAMRPVSQIEYRYERIACRCSCCFIRPTLTYYRCAFLRSVASRW
jgi:hypothetical protein